MKNIFFFIFGLIIGSFLNSVIYRLEKKESFLKGRSHCPWCGRILSFKDLIPVLSFLILKGKCRYCRKKISLQYPLVEISCGILFFLFSLKFNSFDLIFYLLIGSFLILIFVYDLKYFLIPDKIIYPPILISFFYRILKPEIGIKNLAFGILPSFFFLAIILISREKWMGFGDFKLAILIGLILGWPKILVSLFFSFFSGAVIGLILVILKKKNFKSEIPFAPFLVSGTFFAIFLPQFSLNFYLQNNLKSLIIF